MAQSIKQCPTPLNTAFFSCENIDLLQQVIRVEFKKQTNMTIDVQNRRDLFAIMRAVFINNSVNPYSDVNKQIRQINSVVVQTALGQINTGVNQYLGYVKHVNDPIDLLNNPKNTSTYGNKIDINSQIGV